MTFLTALGGFPEMVLGLAFSLGCALRSFVCDLCWASWRANSIVRPEIIME